MFIIASVFILGQNYAVIAAGGFTFKYQDILLMPSYEPLMWGYYFLTFKRFLADPALPQRVDIKAIGGLIMVSACFVILANNSALLNFALLGASAVLFLMFHEPYDIYFALTGFVMGTIVDTFGVHAGLWWFPAPDALGIPFWIPLMWVIAGLMGRRFLIPLSIMITRKFWKEETELI